jgi:hypothetical protein
MTRSKVELRKITGADDLNPTTPCERGEIEQSFDSAFFAR